MDCEKFEAAMIDELYDELDELTSAAAKRHMAGCARCSARIGGLRATRRVLSSAGGVPLVEAPSTLEDRVLAAAREAQRVVPFRRRLANAISAAGSWAMRPQTQMAAVFLLMIGTSVVFLRGGQKSAPSGAAPRDQGAPAASVAQVAREESLDTEAANAAHGALRKAGEATASTPAPPPAAAPAPVTGGYADSRARAANDDEKGAVAAGRGGLLDETKRKEQSLRDTYGGPSNAGAIGGAGGYASGTGESSSSSFGAARPASPQAAPPAPPAAGPLPAPTAEANGEDATAGGTAFEAARQLFAQKNYAEATRQFDALAQNGDARGELWAARSVRDGSGCSAAVGRYDALAARRAGSSIGSDALLEAGQCYRTMGNFEIARARLVRLLTVPSHMARAQRELDAMSPKNSRAMPRKAAEPSQQQAPKLMDQAY